MLDCFINCLRNDHDVIFRIEKRVRKLESWAKRQARGCSSTKQPKTWTASNKEIILIFPKASGIFERGPVLSNSSTAANEHHCLEMPIIMWACSVQWQFRTTDNESSLLPPPLSLSLSLSLFVFLSLKDREIPKLITYIQLARTILQAITRWLQCLWLFPVNN